MTSAKQAGSIAAKLGLGVLAGIGIYLVCVLVTYLLGGMYYSVTLGALVALAVSVVILAYRWMRRRTATSWPMVGAMVCQSPLYSTSVTVRLLGSIKIARMFASSVGDSSCYNTA